MPSVDAAGIALNALGFSLIQLGDVEDGPRVPARGDRDRASPPSDAAART